MLPDGVRLASVTSTGSGADRALHLRSAPAHAHYIRAVHSGVARLHERRAIRSTRYGPNSATTYFILFLFRMRFCYFVQSSLAPEISCNPLPLRELFPRILAFNQHSIL